MTKHDELLNVHGVARVFRLPVAWVQAEADRGRLPCLRVGRRRLFSLRAVRAALVERAGTEPEDANDPDDEGGQELLAKAAAVRRALEGAL